MIATTAASLACPGGITTFGIHKLNHWKLVSRTKNLAQIATKQVDDFFELQKKSIKYKYIFVYRKSKELCDC